MCARACGCILRLLLGKENARRMKHYAEQIETSDADAQATGPCASPAEPRLHANPAEPRILGLFPARVRGVDSSGTPFLTQTVIVNFGATEFDLRLSLRVEAGCRLLVVTDIHEATVALHGNVLRAEPQADGTHRTTVSVTHHRFL
jgi:hypothetical protein